VVVVDGAVVVVGALVDVGSLVVVGPIVVGPIVVVGAGTGAEGRGEGADSAGRVAPCRSLTRAVLVVEVHAAMVSDESSATETTRRVILARTAGYDTTS
jgi:hypothetical protein